MKGSILKIDNVIDMSEERQENIEIPCKDLDLDCLPDENGIVPFGNYQKCYLYDPFQGMCPLLPVKRIRHKEQ